MRILVVDDNAVIRKTIGDALEEAGYVCHYAENGLDGIKQSLKNKYQLIITDIDMPLIDGLKFIQRIKASEKGKNIPVLVLTSRKDAESIYHARELGIHNYVLKPIDPKALLARVGLILDSSASI